MTIKKSLSCAFALATLTFAACGGGSEGGTTDTRTDVFARDILPLVTATCASGGCHEAGAGGILINVSSPDSAYANVQSLLVKFNSSSSDLITSLTRGMPPGGRSTTEYQATVAPWIDAGAVRYEGEEPAEDLPPIDWKLYVDDDGDGTVDGDADLDGTNDEHYHMLDGATFVDEDQLAHSGQYYIPPESIQVTFVNPTTRVAVTDPRGASPVVTFQILNPKNANAPYTDLLPASGIDWPEAWHTGWDKQWVMKAGSAAAWVSDPRRTANLEIIVAWDNNDFVMNWSTAEVASTALSKARGQPITAQLSNYYVTSSTTGKVTSLRAGLWTYNEASATYTVNFSYLAGTTPKAVGAEAAGSGTISISGKQYWVDDLVNTPFTYTASGTTYTYLNPTTSEPVSLPTTYQTQLDAGLASFAINPTGVEAVPRREVVDNARCNRCHTFLSFHGSNRNGKALTCATCHNPNATSSLDPIATIDFKYMIHAIHAGSIGTPGGMRENDYAFGNSRTPSEPYNFGDVWFPSYLNKCEVCHLPGTWALPYLGTGVGTTISAGTNANDPADNLRISPTAALCSACHDTALVRAHIEYNGGVFNAVQDLSPAKLTKSYYYVNGTGSPSVQRLESCVLCHEKATLRTQHNF